MDKKIPLVSICCVTYNQESYICQCLDGFVSQKTNFHFEILVHDDASLDNTTNIVKEYESKYPDLFRCVYQTENQFYKQNVLVNVLFPMSRGKYIALCEGDDYWTDPHKLQKQVVFLEDNPHYSLCFHDAIVLWEDKSQLPKYFCSKEQKETSTIEDVIEKWFIPTASMVMRKEYITPLPDWFKEIYNGDYCLHLLLAERGKIKYFDEVMSVYRRQAGSGSLLGNPNITSDYVLRKKIELMNYINKEFNNKYDKQIKIKIGQLKKELKNIAFRKKYPYLKYFEISRYIRFIKKILEEK